MRAIPWERRRGVSPLPFDDTLFQDVIGGEKGSRRKQASWWDGGPEKRKSTPGLDRRKLVLSEHMGPRKAGKERARIGACHDQRSFLSQYHESEPMVSNSSDARRQGKISCADRT